MKRVLITIIAVIFVTLFIPLIIVSFLSGTNEQKPVISVYVKADDRVEEMEIDKYLAGVVAAEMPADFEKEALKAQAVAARTYLYSHISEAEKGNIAESHNGAVICTDSTHCQAWTKDAQKKIRQAVKDTKNQIITYNGEPISAVFHSTSPGRTESAADVWGAEVPYLQGVDSPGDIHSPKYISEVQISTEDFKKVISENIGEINWDNNLFGNIIRSQSGGIKTIDVGDHTIKGTELRRFLDLKSTNAELEEKEGNILIKVKGYGHGVGMSQYGANYFAREGMSYEEILKAYYTGVDIIEK